jgi:hypothetical protein
LLVHAPRIANLVTQLLALFRTQTARAALPIGRHDRHRLRRHYRRPRLRHGHGLHRLIQGWRQGALLPALFTLNLLLHPRLTFGFSERGFFRTGLRRNASGHCPEQGNN